MHIDRTKYTAHYENGILVAHWVSVEMVLDVSKGDNANDALNKSRETVEQWNNSNSSGLSGGSTPPPHGPSQVIQVGPEDRAIGVTVESIMTCEDLITLDTYRFLIKKDMELMRAFELRKLQLNNPYQVNRKQL